MEFNALVDFDSKSTKDKLLALLDVAEVILEHDVKIDGKTLDDAEMRDADCEDAFEELRSAMRTLVQQIDYYVD